MRLLIEERVCPYQTMGRDERVSLECPDGHFLEAYEIQRGFTVDCDSCHITFNCKIAPLFYGCRRCDFDLCQVIHSAVLRYCFLNCARRARSFTRRSSSFLSRLPWPPRWIAQRCYLDVGSYPDPADRAARYTLDSGVAASGGRTYAAVLSPWPNGGGAEGATTPRRAALKARVAQRRQVTSAK